MKNVKLFEEFWPFLNKEKRKEKKRKEREAIEIAMRDVRRHSERLNRGREDTGSDTGNALRDVELFKKNHESFHVKTFEECGSGDLAVGIGGKKKKKKKDKNTKSMLKPMNWTGQLG